MNRNYRFTQKEIQYLPIRRMNRNSRIELNVRVACLILFSVLMLALFIRWTNEHTNRAEAAYGKYEQCVQDTYGVSATKFYQVYGEPANCK